jgi:hypothetical protein
MSGDSLGGSKFIPSWDSDTGGGEPTVTTEENLWGAPPPSENLWSSQNGQENTKPEGPKCPIHVGKDCKKGICKALSDLLKKEEREQKELNKNKNKNAKNWNKKNNRYQKCM